MSNSTKIGVAAVAGLCSSSLSSPAELVMTLQQLSGKSIIDTVKDLVRTHGITSLYRGGTATALRETVWCASYLALGPVLSTKMHDILPNTFGEKDSATLSQRASASMCGSIAAGLVAVLATQPVDTVKTVLQGQAMTAKGAERNISFVCQKLWQNGSIATFYKGLVPRGIRLVGAVFILSESKKILEEKFKGHHILA